MTDENTPLLENGGSSDYHEHFCLLVGISPSDKSTAAPSSNAKSLYNRALRKRKSQRFTYNITAAVSNTLLLSQVVLGATLTALGASNASHVLITIFGVANTIIAGLVAYLKSRGQPMRARMFLDDLEHVVDEIENSRVMWLGIKYGAHGYDEVDVDCEISVRSEVLRLNRLYEAAVKKYVQNNPDLYSAGGLLDPITGLRSRPEPTAPPGAIAAATPLVGDEDEHQHEHGHEHERPATAKKPIMVTKSAADKNPAISEAYDGGNGTPEEPASSKEAINADQSTGEETPGTAKTNDKSGSGEKSPAAAEAGSSSSTDAATNDKCPATANANDDKTEGTNEAPASAKGR